MKKFNPFTGEMESDATSWIKNKEGRFEDHDGKIYDDVKSVYVKDPLTRLNEINNSACIISKQYMAMVFEVSRIVKGATDHTNLIALLERHRGILDRYEESL